MPTPKHPAHKPMLLMVAVALAGCASPWERFVKPPQLTVASKQPPREMAACVAGQWGAHMPDVATGALADGYTVSISNQFAGIEAVVRITAAESGSQAVYTAQARPLLPGWLMDGVNACT